MDYKTAQICESVPERNAIGTGTVSYHWRTADPRPAQRAVTTDLHRGNGPMELDSVQSADGQGASRRSTNWPIEAAALVAVAVRGPVAPAAVRRKSAASEATLIEPEAATSARSAIPLGGVNVALVAVPKKPMSIDPAEPTTDGAVIAAALALA